MEDTSGASNGGDYLARAIETSIRLGVIVLLVVWCFYITRPFIVPAIWGIIIATAIQPVHVRLARALGGRDRTAAGLLVVFGLAVLIVPAVMFAGSVVDSGQWLADGLQEGSLEVPPPPEGLRGWPVIGESVYSFWTLANTNLEAAIRQLGPQLTHVGTGLLSAAAGMGLALLQFVISVVIAGLLVASSAGAHRVAARIATRLAGDRGEALLQVAGATVRSVAQGILGVAVIQASLLAIGLVAAGVPHASLWALLGLLCAVVQLPLLLFALPIMFYVFSTASTLTAVLFAIWSTIASLSDNVLKPMLLGRGLDLPTIVIFMGAIGGFMASGFIGLFVGAVIVALGYMLFMAWLAEGSGDGSNPEAGEVSEG